MKKITPSTIALVLLSAGVGALAAILFRGDDPPPAPAPVAKPAAAEKASVAEIPGALERALRRRIGQLEAEIAALRAGPSAATNAPARPEVHQLPKPGDFRPPSPREMMENLKKNDPKKYAEFQRRFAHMRQRQLERTQGRLDFLGSVDTAGMTDAERANHEKLQELLAQRENMPDPGEMTEEEMRTAMQQRRELDRAIRKASADERTTLLRQTASALGLEGEDAAVLTSTLQEVIQATESDRGGPHGPPPGGAPGGQPPGGGR